MSTRKSSPILPLVFAALAAVAAAFGINQLGTELRGNQPSEAPAQVRPRWTATASGRVEPRGGEIRLTSLASARIVAVLARANDKVQAGDLLVQLDDGEALARMMAADAEAGVRKRERDTETNVPRLAQDRRIAEDRLNTTERSIASARLDLDRLIKARHANATSVTPQQLTDARAKLDAAIAQLPLDRDAYRTAQLAAGAPLPTRLEAGLSAARSELSLAEAALERTRVRAPVAGTLLQLHARVGEVAAPTAEAPLVVMGDLTGLRVRAEVEERDSAKVRVGQMVVLKTDAFGDREFSGRVASIAESLRPPKLAQRGPRRPSDIDALEVLVDVDQAATLLPGMRVDVFFKVEPVAPEPSPPQPGSPGGPKPTASVPKSEPAKPEPAKADAGKSEAAKPGTPKPDAPTPAPPKPATGPAAARSETTAPTASEPPKPQAEQTPAAGAPEQPAPQSKTN